MKETIVNICIWTIIILFCFAFLWSNHWGKGEEKESLLDFTCEELEKGDISTDGKGGTFVTGMRFTGFGVDKERIKKAMIEKGCLLQEFDEFHYKYNRRPELVKEE